MPWKPHALANATLPTVDLRVGQKCFAIAELAGVPRGTRGKVQLANGYVWMRYRVAFDNGVEISNLDGRHLSAERPSDS
jgi:hypothetical protein